VKLRRDAMTRWRSAAERRLDREISTLAAGDRPDRIDRIVIPGTRPAELVLHAASRADLLVVGSRGRGGVTGTLLGSVSHQCVRHASVPVMVVPSTAVARVPLGASSEARYEVLAAGVACEGAS
jgi:nucleotide-binding universal stress UspA family protein